MIQRKAVVQMEAGCECAKPAIPVNLRNGLIYKWSEEKQLYSFPRLSV